jgi:predicted nuclease of restriction endonuclease-like (RecB) superfamily
MTQTIDSETMVKRKSIDSIVDETAQKISNAVINCRDRTKKELNRIAIATYWALGEQTAESTKMNVTDEWLYEQLSSDLRNEDPANWCYTPENLKLLHRFYLTYAKDKELLPLLIELDWACNLVILERCRDNIERELFLRKAIENGWTRKDLIQHIEARAFEKGRPTRTARGKESHRTIPGRKRSPKV